MMPWLHIVGIGEDGVEGLSPAAQTLVRNAALVVGGARHLALARPLIGSETMAWPSPISDAFPALLARHGSPVCVLASGDPMCFGIGKQLAALVPRADMAIVPAPSAFSLACARLGWALQDCSLVSFCGRPVETLLPLLQPGARVLALCADETTPGAVLALLQAHGFGGSDTMLLEALGGPRERIRPITAAPDDADPLNMLAIHVRADAGARGIPLASGLADDLFEHDGQITKREIRAMTLSALAPRQGEMLWDVGGGSGSVSVEWMLRHTSNRAIAVEQDEARAPRIARNALALGVPALRVVRGIAPDALRNLPMPDAVFVGGGVASPGVLDAAWHGVRTGGRLVANAVTLEAEAALFAAHQARGGTLTRLHVDRLDKIGGKQCFRPALPVTQWAVTKC